MLEFAASANRVVLTHDHATMPAFAYMRVQGRLPMPGLVVVPSEAPIGTVLDEILLVARATLPGELEGHVIYLPLS